MGRRCWSEGDVKTVGFNAKKYKCKVVARFQHDWCVHLYVRCVENCVIDVASDLTRVLMRMYCCVVTCNT